MGSAETWKGTGLPFFTQMRYAAESAAEVRKHEDL